MSQYRFETEKEVVIAGCDTRLKYVFMSIHNKDDFGVIYSNMTEEDPFSIQDFNFFMEKAKEFEIDFPLDIAETIQTEIYLACMLN